MTCGNIRRNQRRLPGASIVISGGEVTLDKVLFAIRILYTLLLLVSGIPAFLAGKRICSSKPELSPEWSFFGTSDWSVFGTVYYMSFFYVLSAAVGYFVKLMSDSYGNTDSLSTGKVSARTPVSALRFVSTLVLMGWGLLAFCAATDIWHGSEPDYTMEWTIMYAYFVLYCFYLFVNVIDILLKVRQ